MLNDGGVSSTESAWKCPGKQTARLADGEGKQRILKAISDEFRKDLTKKELELTGLRDSGWRSEPNPGR